MTHQPGRTLFTLRDGTIVKKKKWKKNKNKNKNKEKKEKKKEKIIINRKALQLK